MNLAVRFYSDAENKPTNMPDNWPYQVVELGSSSTLPDDGHSWNLMTREEYSDYINEYQAEYDAWEEENLRPVLHDVTPRQMRQALVLSGVSTEMITNALASLSEPTRSLAQIEWEYSIAFQRNRPLVTQVGMMLGWTDSQLDDLWRLAASL